MTQGYLFNRRAELTIVKTGETETEITTIKDLRIKFKIDKNSESSPNKSSIEVYNLNKVSRDLIKKDNVCILKVGYQENFDTIFKGDITKITNVKEENNIVTKMEVGDSQNKIKNTHAEINFTSGKKISQAVDYLVRQFNLPVVYKTPLGQEQFATGYSISGNAKTIMDSILKRIGFSWSIQDNTILINKPDIKDEVEYLIISPTSGLIDIPIIREEGIEFISLIQPSIKPEVTIKLVSSIKEGLFKIRQALFEGDTHEGNWHVRCIAV